MYWVKISKPKLDPISFEPRQVIGLGLVINAPTYKYPPSLDLGAYFYLSPPSYSGAILQDDLARVTIPLLIA